MENREYFVIQDTSWSLIFDDTNDEDKSIYPDSKVFIKVYESETEVADLSTLNELTKRDYTIIGGTTNVCNVSAGNFVYVQADTAPYNGFSLPKGQADPETDVSTIAEAIAEVNELFNEHADDEDNPHATDKTDVGLGNLVNRISNIIKQTPDGAIVTDHAIKAIFDIVNAHLNDSDNPHSNTAETIDLENVANLPIAVDEDDILNAINDEMYATIKAVFDIVRDSEQKSAIDKPNQIISGDLETLSEIEKSLYDPMSETVVIDGANLVLKAGLKVSFMNNGTIKISNELTRDIPLAASTISTEISPRSGFHYLYVDIAEDSNNIIGFGSTYSRPHIGIQPMNPVIEEFFLNYNATEYTVATGDESFPYEDDVLDLDENTAAYMFEDVRVSNYTAESLAVSINSQGGHVVEVKKLTASGWVSYTVGSGTGDFDIAQNVVHEFVTDTPTASRDITILENPYGSSSSDFIHKVTGQVYNADSNPICRVYVGKVSVTEVGHISHVINVPQSDTISMKVASLISPDGTLVVDNPYFGPISVYPEIKIGDMWADPRFEETAGVHATWMKHDPDFIYVQSGSAGLAAPAPISGSAFPDDILSEIYSGSASIRLIISKL